MERESGDFYSGIGPWGRAAIAFYKNVAFIYILVIQQLDKKPVQLQLHIISHTSQAHFIRITIFKQNYTALHLSLSPTITVPVIKLATLPFALLLHLFIGTCF